MEKSKHLSIHTEEDDYHLQSFFPKGIPKNIEPLIKHRVKLLLKEDIIFQPDEMQYVNSCCIIDG